jgi:NAD kinase
VSLATLPPSPPLCPQPPLARSIGLIRRLHVAHGRYLTTTHPHLTLIAEPHTATDHPSYPLITARRGEEELLAPNTDLVITLGGDGTILHTSNLFGGGECPPVLSFSMGSLGFLLPFRESPAKVGILA